MSTQEIVDALVLYRTPTLREQARRVKGSRDKLLYGKASALHIAIVKFLRKRDGDFCGICRGSFIASEFPSIDHVIPRSRGGPDDLENFQLAHWRCNLKKSNNA